MITGSGVSDRFENDDVLSLGVRWPDPMVEIGLAGIDCEISFGSLPRPLPERCWRGSLVIFLERGIGLAFTWAATRVAAT